MLQIAVPLTDDFKGVIYNRNMFTVQNTDNAGAYPKAYGAFL